MSKEKNLVQNEAEHAWRHNNCKGALAICTGGGKSKIFINVLHKEPEKWLLVVPTTKLRDENWRDEFKKWKKLTYFNRYVDKCCYKSLHKYDLSKYAGVCLDEGHNLTVNNSKPFFKDDAFKRLKILYLSATTPTDPNKVGLMYRLGIPTVYTLTLDQGVDRGLVAPYRIKVIRVPMDTRNNIAIKYKRKGKEYKFNTSEEKQYKFATKRIAEALEANKDAKFQYFNRMRVIYNLKSKKAVAKQLLSQIKDDKRTLVFAQSIDQIEDLTKCTYHSKTDDTCYNDFINEKINRLGVVMAVNEGTNIPNLDVAAIVQLNSNSKDLIQRIGRIVRYREGHIASIYILVSKDTVDEEWVTKALSSFDSSRIKYVEYNGKDDELIYPDK